MKKKPTIDDVAAHAQVARTTVSRVLNNGPNVRGEVRERVHAAIEALGYQVNAQARRLASGSDRRIGLILATEPEAELGSYYHSGLELGAMHACAGHGFTLVTHPAVPGRPAHRERIIGLARRRSVDGLVLTPPYSDDVALIKTIRALKYPVVCISAGPDARIHTAWVSIDDNAAGRAIGELLVKLGHRRFAYIDGIEGHVSAGMRLHGFMEALAGAGIEPGSVAVERGNFTFRSGVEISARLLDRADRATALVCANDDMAAGSLLTAHKLGLNIPGDVSITGFDDTPVSEIVWPPLTTVHQPIRQLGAGAVERLVELVGNGAAEPAGGTIVPFRLVERESTSVARGD